MSINAPLIPETDAPRRRGARTPGRKQSGPDKQAAVDRPRRSSIGSVLAAEQSEQSEGGSPSPRPELDTVLASARELASNSEADFAVSPIMALDLTVAHAQRGTCTAWRAAEFAPITTFHSRLPGRQVARVKRNSVPLMGDAGPKIVHADHEGELDALAHAPDHFVSRQPLC